MHKIYRAGYLIKQPRITTTKEGIDIVRSRMLIVNHEETTAEIVNLTASGDMGESLYEYNIGKYLRVGGTGCSTVWWSRAHGDLITAVKLTVFEIEDRENDIYLLSAT